VPIGRTFSDQASNEKLPDANIKNPILGQILVKLFESFSIEAKPTSSNPAVITANQAMYKFYQKREESPYKPETFDSRSKRANAHVVAHKDLQGSA